MTFDLNSMDRDALSTLKRDVEKALKTLDQRRMAEARIAAEKAAREHGFSLDELNGGKAGKGAATAPKFANPEDATQTWSGRGRQPQWYKDAIAAGQSPEDLAI